MAPKSIATINNHIENNWNLSKVLHPFNIAKFHHTRSVDALWDDYAIAVIF
ncbi:hypothetical protein QE382_002630 [Sphingobacterium zeae]|uniref:Transposase n=1 Tax=Sphingobacterium zeae TaxID=1776859 RepID=A0ABU0U6Q4_9SPHI|nr:hypothetical protein [Sphingobacterium zeae]